MSESQHKPTNKEVILTMAGILHDISIKLIEVVNKTQTELLNTIMALKDEEFVPLVFDPKSGIYLPTKITYNQYKEIEEMRAKRMAERETQTIKCVCGGVMTFPIPLGKPMIGDIIKCPGCGKKYVMIRPGNVNGTGYEPEPLERFPDCVPPVGPR